MPDHLAELDEAEVEQVQQLAERIVDLVDDDLVGQPRILLNAILAAYRGSAVVAVIDHGFGQAAVLTALATAYRELREDLAENAAPQPQLH
ncbi:hypothetical protein [Inquilinus sp.]|jgi:hypothetical protein|uniref:hypothetical protein n=1 Tax=Inquilinus sp. TaxID=1932117 RepID=UPI0037837E9A